MASGYVFSVPTQRADNRDPPLRSEGHESDGPLINVHVEATSA